MSVCYSHAATLDPNNAEGEKNPSRDAAHTLRPKRRQCHGATAVCLLIVVKRYLQSCYGITNSHLAAFTTGDTAHKIDKSVSRRAGDAFSTSDLRLDSAADENDEQLYDRYQQLSDMIRA